MRWGELFDDLEAQAQALAVAEREAEIEDRTRSEVGRLGICDRLRPAVGSPVRISCLGQLTLKGCLQRVHPEWILLEEDTGGEALVQLASVLSLGSLARLSATPGSMSVVDGRFGLALALRGVARDRSNVRLHLADGAVVAGTLDRVGADFVELAVHPAGEPRRRAAVQEILLVSVSALVAVRRQG